MDKKFLRDAAERIGWTAVQAGLAVLALYVVNVPLEYAPIVAAVLAAAKAFVAKKVGPADAALPSPKA